MMAKTKIEWCDVTLNCFWGCLKGCSYCQARNMARRFGRCIGEARGYSEEVIQRMVNFRPVFLEDQLAQISKLKKPSRIFVSFMGDPFGAWNVAEAMDLVLDATRAHPQHTFIMLTKQPQNLRRWSPFPDNVWPGVSVTNQAMHNEASLLLLDLDAWVKLISYEPLLEHIRVHPYDLVGVQWVIIGQQTPIRARTTPKPEWIGEIVRAADTMHIPVFLKDNLLELVNYESPETAFAFNAKGEYRQEFPRPSNDRAVIKTPLTATQ